MSPRHYTIARVSFIGLAGFLMYNHLWIGLLTTGMVVLAGLIFAQATMISMYTAHRRSMEAQNKAIKEKELNSKKGGGK